METDSKIGRDEAREKQQSGMKHRDYSFWLALLTLVAVSLGAQLIAFLKTEPEDVLIEVRQLRELIEVRTYDRFHRKEFDSFLRNNPELIPPDNWDEIRRSF